MTSRRLAIIGGGASATLLLAHLAALKGARGLHVDVYDRAGAFARGIAYSTPHSCHLLNVRASNMSALADQPDDFVRWIDGYGFTADSFAPRRLYGSYLAEKWERAKDSLSIHAVTDDVTACSASPHGFELVCASGARACYDHVVQATGNCVALRPHLDADAERDYADSPWDVDYGALKQAGIIVLVGSGLSAMDAVLALDAHDYQGRIQIVSRRGLFPAVHVKSPPADFGLFPYPSTARALLTAVRAAVRRHDGPWQAVIDSLRPHTNPIWQALPSGERARFTRRLLTYWNTHRHRMAPEVAAVIDSWERAGRLQRIRADVRGIGAGGVVRFSSGGEVRADKVINCLGYRYDEKRRFDAALPLGPACFGALFETTAIPEIRAQSAVLAAQIAP